ncbi:hypothetical protein GCM10009794_02410 [Rothia terrae]
MSAVSSAEHGGTFPVIGVRVRVEILAHFGVDSVGTDEYLGGVGDRAVIVVAVGDLNEYAFGIFSKAFNLLTCQDAVLGQTLLHGVEKHHL